MATCSASVDSGKRCPYDFLFKLLVIGESSVGKSSLLLRFTDNVFSQFYSNTIGVDFRVRTLCVDDTIIKLQIWDTAGQEKFRTIASSYYRGANGILIVYDITNRKTFESIPYWLNNVEKFGCPAVSRLLVGNKADLESQRQVSTEEAKSCHLWGNSMKQLHSVRFVAYQSDLEEFLKKFADDNNLRFIETSAKSAENVEEAFREIAREIKGIVAPAPYVAEDDSIRLGETQAIDGEDGGGGSWWWYC